MSSTIQISVDDALSIEFRDAIAKRPDLAGKGNTEIAKTFFAERIREILKSK